MRICMQQPSLLRRIFLKGDDNPIGMSIISSARNQICKICATCQLHIGVTSLSNRLGIENLCACRHEAPGFALPQREQLSPRSRRAIQAAVLSGLPPLCT